MDIVDILREAAGFLYWLLTGHLTDVFSRR
jgi:hypothetical protein